MLDNESIKVMNIEEISQWSKFVIRISGLNPGFFNDDHLFT